MRLMAEMPEQSHLYAYFLACGKSKHNVSNGDLLALVRDPRIQQLGNGIPVQPMRLRGSCVVSDFI